MREAALRGGGGKADRQYGGSETDCSRGRSSDSRCSAEEAERERRWCTYEKYVSILLVRTAEMAPTICRSIRKEAGKMSRAADGVRARRRSDRQDTGRIIIFMVSVSI